MKNQTKPTYSEQITQAAQTFKTFGVPQRVFMDGEEITDEINKIDGSIESWLRRLAVAFNNFNITAFAMSRINGVVKLYVKSIY